MLFGLLIAMLMGACSDNIVPDDVPPVNEGGALVPVSLNLEGLFNDEGAKTYSLTTPKDTVGSSIENWIDDVTVFVFNSSNVCEKIIQQTSYPFTPTDTVLVTTGSKTFIAVVNGANKIKTPYSPYLYYAPDDEKSHIITYNEIRQKLTEPTSSLPVSSFLMTGEKSVVLDVKPEESPNSVNIQVERAVAKIKIFFTKSGNAALHNLKMHSLTLNQGAEQVYVLQKPLPDLINYGITTPQMLTFNEVNSSNHIKTVLGSGKKDIPIQGTSELCMLADTLYVYETLCGRDSSKAVYFDMEVEVGSPSNIRTARFYLAEDGSSGDSIYNVRRNHWYNVYINIKDPGVDSVNVTIVSCPWNVATPMDTIMGGGGIFETATPFKLVKNYTADELDWANSATTSTSDSYAAIASHSKGASWIEYTVTDSTEWRLDLKGSAQPRNQNVKVSLDLGVTWVDTFPIMGFGDGAKHRIYVYRPYLENTESELGPILYVELKDDQDGLFKYIRDFVIQPRDITPVPTNSYIMRPKLIGAPANETRAYIPLAGVYSYWEDYLLANGSSIPNGTITADLLWQDRTGTVVDISSIRVIDAGRRDSAYIYVEAGDVQGNAVVEMKVGGDTYWSFHLWVTDYNPNEAAGQKSYNSVTFMDRDLGALDNRAHDDGEARGLYYQFGRKDPFPKGTGWNTAFSWYNKSGVALSSSLTPGTITPASVLRPKDAIPMTIDNPMVFYNYTSPSWPLFSEEKYLWRTAGGNKTAFDPCPAGWRIPDVSSWSGVTDGIFPLSYYNGSMYGRANLNLGFYPFSGYIQANGSVGGMRYDAYYWSSHFVDNSPSPSTNGAVFYISEIGLSTSSDTNAVRGASVRCVKE